MPDWNAIYQDILQEDDKKSFLEVIKEKSKKDLATAKEHPFKTALSYSSPAFRKETYQTIPEALGFRRTGKQIEEASFFKPRAEGFIPAFARDIAKRATSGLADIATTPATYAAGPVLKGLGAGALQLAPPLERFIARQLPTMGKGLLTAANPEYAAYQKALQGPGAPTAKELIAGQIEKETGAPFPGLVYGRTMKGTKEAQFNIERYKPETQQALLNLKQQYPEILSRKKISEAQLVQMAEELDSTPIARKILSMPYGQQAAEIYKINQGNDALIRSALEGDLRDLGANLKTVLQKDQFTAASRLASEAGLALRQQQISVEAQSSLANLINQRIAQAQKDPFLKSGELRRVINGLVDLRKQVLDKDFNPTWFDKGYEFWLNSILSGPWTHATNIISNAGFAVTKPLEKTLAATVDTLAGMFTGKRTHYLSEVPAQMKGLGQALFTKQNLPTGIGTQTKFEAYEKPFAGLIKGTKGKIVRLPTQGLVSEDNFFKRLTGFMELNGRATAIAKQEGLRGAEFIARRNQLFANPTEKLAEEVNAEQLIRTFQDSTGIGEYLKMFPQKGVMRWILPFRRTLSSIITKAVDRTPVGFVKVGVKGLKTRQGVPYPQKEVVTDLANALTGTGIAFATLLGLKKGKLIGAAPRDRSERDLFYSQGKQPYSLVIGDKVIPFSRLEPYGTAMMLLTDAFQGYEQSDKEMPTGKLMDAVTNVSYSLTNKSFLSGMTNMVKALSDPEMYGASWAQRVIAGFSPFSGLTRQVNQMIDLDVKQPEGVKEQLMSQLPFVSRNVPTRLNVFGELVKRKPVGFSRYTPFPITRLESNIVASELERLDVPLNYPSKVLDDKKLSRDEYNKYLMSSGGIIHKTLHSFMTSPNYKNMNDNLKKMAVERIITSARGAARTAFVIKKRSQKNRSWDEIYSEIVNE